MRKGKNIEKNKGHIRVISCSIIFILTVLVFNQIISTCNTTPINSIGKNMGFSEKGKRSLVDSNTLVYYSFDNPNDLGNDDSKSADTLDLTIVNGASQTGNSLYGRALALDGVNDRASIPAHSSMHIQGALTIDVWVFWRGPGTGGNYDTIIAQSGHYWLNVRREEPSIGLICFSAGGPWDSIVSNQRLQRNEWTRISIVRTPSTGGMDHVKMYINGILDSSDDILESNPSSTAITYIGAWDWEYFHSFNGYIDKVSISDIARGIGDSVGFWNFNEGAGAEARDRTQKSYADGSLLDYNHNNGDGDTPPQWIEEGKYGKALNFDGIDDYVKIEANDKLHLVAETTIEAWVKYDGPGGDTYGATDTILGQRGHFWLHIPRTGSKAGKVVFESGNGPWHPDVVSTTTLQKNVWVHIAIVRTSNTNVRIYIDGILNVEDTTYQPTGISANNVFIGSWGGYKHFFKGCIDEVRISNYDKTFESDYDYGGDVLILPFEGTAMNGNDNTGILDDKSAFDSDMTAVGNPTSIDDGKFKKGISFDGIDECLKIVSPVPASLKPSTVTVEAWIYPTQLQNAYIVKNANHLPFGGETGGYSLSIETGIIGGLQIVFDVYKGKENKITVTSDLFFPSSNWWHVAGVYDGSTSRVYINGVCEDIASVGGPIFYGVDWGLYIGGDQQNSKLFKGKIDEVRISNYPRTFHEDTDGDGMSGMYEIMRSPFSDQYNPMEQNGRYGLLVCPRPAPLEDFDCFWSDPKFLYDTLKSHGYLDDDIYLIYDTGADVKKADDNKYGTPPGVTYTDGPATIAELEIVCSDLSTTVDNTDFLFVFTFDHGFDNNGHSQICMNDGQGGYELLQDNVLSGQTYLGGISYKYRAIFMQQCYSGGFIDDLSDSATAIATACQSDEIARETDGTGDENQRENGEFNFYFMSAFAGQTPTNSNHIDADIDDNYFISIDEAYDYVFEWDSYNPDGGHYQQHDSDDDGVLDDGWQEHPQIDDDGNGQSQQDGDNNDGGNIADKIFL